AAFVHDLAHQFAGRAAMMKSAGHLDLGLLHRAVNAPRGRLCRTIPVIGTVPHGVSRDDLGGASQDLAVERIRRNLLRRVDLEPYGGTAHREAGHSEPTVVRPNYAVATIVDLDLDCIR